jgi:hypothetical protein
MKYISIAFIGMALVMSDTVAAKEPFHDRRPASADQYYGLYQNSSQATSTFDHSARRGHEGDCCLSQSAQPWAPNC